MNTGKFSLRGKRVAVLQGGPGVERDVSLRSGAAVLRAMAELGAEAVGIDVKGPDFELPGDVELAFNMIHGTFGEDGGIQEILEARGIPYTGDGVAASRLAFDKILSKQAFEKAGVATPKWEVAGVGCAVTMPFPVVLKAPRQGSSLGVHIVRNAETLQSAVEDCLQYDDRILVEEFVQGRELTVGMLGREPLPIVEIVPKGGFYGYENKYTQGASEYHVPAQLTPDQTDAVSALARRAHVALGLEVYSRVDLLLGGNGDLRVLEANTIPGMTETSLLPKAASKVGLSFAALCERIAELSMTKGGTRR